MFVGLAFCRMALHGISYLELCDDNLILFCKCFNVFNVFIINHCIEQLDGRVLTTNIS